MCSIKGENHSIQFSSSLALDRLSLTKIDSSIFFKAGGFTVNQTLCSDFGYIV